MKKKAIHNTHLHLPKRLWRQAKALANAEETSLTKLVIEGLQMVLEKRRKEHAEP